MKQKIVTAFIGGLLGILLSGYVFYVTGEHYFLLIPAGTFAGCLIGFSFFNFPKIAEKVHLLTGKLKFKKIHFNPVFPILKTVKYCQGLVKKIKIKKWENELVLGLKEFTFWFYKSFIEPWKSIPKWLKQHPMNGYIIQEIIITTLITAFFGYFVYLKLLLPTIEIFSITAKDNHAEAIFLLYFILILCFLGYSFMMFHHIFYRNQKTFYRDFEIYSKYKILGVIGRIMGRFFYSSLAFTSMIGGLAVVVTGGMFYGIVSFVIMLFLWGITSLIYYVTTLINKKQETSILVITMIVTTISYFSYRQHFNSQLLIWLIAFLTGSFSSLTVKLIFSFKTVNKMEAVYKFFNPDYVDIDDRKTYFKNFLGIILFIPSVWFIKICDLVSDKVTYCYLKKFA